MENTTEEKERFFAQYWGQEIMQCEKCTTQSEVNPLLAGHHFNYFINVRSLSAITDEYAIEIGKVLFDWGFMSHGTKLDIGKHFIKGHMDKLHTIPAKMVDFLRKNGYALPYDGKSVEEQIKLGWVKIRKS